MAAPFSIKRLIEFRDTDAAGIVHFSVYFNLMEVAEHALLRSMGMSVFLEHEGRDLSWPRVSVACDYQAPLRFEDEVEIGVTIARLGGKSITYEFELRKEETICATGSVTAVCCLIEHGGKPRPIEIPDAIRQKLQAFVSG